MKGFSLLKPKPRFPFKRGLGLLLSPLFFPLFLEAETYIFSYKIAIKDGLVINESYRFSKAMVIPARYEVLGECVIDVDEEEERRAIGRVRSAHAEVLECFFERGVGLRDDTTASSLQARSTTTLWIPPTHVIVEFKDGFVMMKIIQPQP